VAPEPPGAWIPVEDEWEQLPLIQDQGVQDEPMRIEELELPIRARSKAISRKKFNSLTQDICAICHDNHKMSEVLTVSCCNQHLGKECYNQWALNKRVVTCPCCRKNSPRVTTYREYARLQENA
jgi:hypothetical protein